MDIITQVSRREWTDFLAQHRGFSGFQSPSMFEVFQHTAGYSPRVFAACAGGKIDALVVSVRIAYLGRGFGRFATRAIITGGPLGNPNCFPALLAAHDKGVRNTALLSQIRNVQPPAFRDLFEVAGYQWEDHTNYFLDLTLGEGAILNGMSQGRRKNIAKAEKSSARLVRLTEADTNRVYDVVQDTYRRAGIPLADQSLFRNALRILLPHGHLLGLGAEWNGRLCAVRLALCWDGYVFDWYAGSTEEGRSIHADEWLVWQVLLKGVQNGWRTFDFGGAGQPKAGYGPGEFKRRFGGRELNVGRFEKRYHPIGLKAAAAVYELWRKLS